MVIYEFCTFARHRIKPIIIKAQSKFHSKNKPKSGYDITKLCEAYPDLKPFVFTNAYNTETINFANPEAVKALNTALLLAYYNISYWEFPNTNLCPPIPGRVDYIHHAAELLEAHGMIKNIRALDIGTGASCIYPLLGHAEYHWRFVGTDVDKQSLKHAQNIIDENGLQDVIKLRYQPEKHHILKGIVTDTDRFDISLCNPPFYKSQQEAFEATTRKLKELKRTTERVVRNFAGTYNELCYKGGEKAFIHNYLYESTLYKDQCFWFSTLVSKQELVKGLCASLKKLRATSIKTIPMGQGNKVSRLVAWTFLTKEAQRLWIK